VLLEEVNKEATFFWRKKQVITNASEDCWWIAEIIDHLP